MRMTIQEMVSAAVAEATYREKLAQAPAPEEKKTSAPPATCPECKNAKADCTCSKEKDAEGCKTAAATDLVEKVASAFDYIIDHFGEIDWEKVAVGEGLGVQASNAPPAKMGPGAGPGSDLMTNMDSPVGGMQSTTTGQATNNQPEPAGKTDDAKKSDGQTNPSTAMMTDMAHVPGGTGMQPQLQEKSASIKRVRDLLKMAADGEAPAKINAGPEPLENPNASASEDNVPRLPAAAQAQANLVQTKDPTKPADVTKQQAKAEPKRQMGEVLTEPAQKKSTDPVLHQNLAAAATAGVKLSSVQAAAARSYLRKIAQAGEDPNASPEEKEKAQKLKEALAKQKDGSDKEKKSQMGMGAPMASPPPTTGMM